MCNAFHPKGIPGQLPALVWAFLLRGRLPSATPRSFWSKAGLEEALPNAVRDEILLAGLLAPLAFTNLRAPLREMISVTDASEQGGAAGEATRFVTATNKMEEKKGSSLRMNALEEERIPLCSILCTQVQYGGGAEKGPLPPWVSRVVLLGTVLPRAPPQLLARGPRRDQGGHR